MLSLVSGNKRIKRYGFLGMRKGSREKERGKRGLEERHMIKGLHRQWWKYVNIKCNPLIRPINKY